MNKGFKIKTKPLDLHKHITRNDPEWSKFVRENYKSYIWNGAKCGAYFGVLLCLFMLYKGCEHKNKLNKQNIEQYGNK